ncbi:hypothetical protein EV06_1972 [Prochlorococcus sp. MIT 0602]|nr:hypothetical protein EV06_1972 [Prochlorococcus sp. MIT 0602]KGG15658.1 hypothetical protein EV07_1623 [Prochlorococcus sp. MIT 0603]
MLAMNIKENNSPENKEEIKEKPVDSLMNYECDEDDDGSDWET